MSVKYFLENINVFKLCNKKNNLLVEKTFKIHKNVEWKMFVIVKNDKMSINRKDNT